MEIDPEKLNARELYRLLTGIVVPRPIAWVTSVSARGVVNAAPFSAFTWVSTDPAMLGFSAGLRDGKPKDTGRNIEAAGHYVVHIADENLIEKLHLSAVDHPEDVSEVAELELTPLSGKMIGTPRIGEAPVAMECVLDRILEFGRTRAQFIIGRVVYIHIRDGLCADGKIDTASLRPISRLGGPKYAKLGEIVEMSKQFHIGPR
jgi:flavin reductase (DIM6/NTAB) family NADH-FMN oxidoreductase RutF